VCVGRAPAHGQGSAAQAVSAPAFVRMVSGRVGSIMCVLDEPLRMVKAVLHKL